MTRLNIEPHGRGANLFEVLDYEFANFFWVLVRNQAAGNLRPGPRRNNCFAAFALVTAGQTIDFEGRTSASPFICREGFFSKKFWHSEELLIALFVKWKLGHLFS